MNNFYFTYGTDKKYPFRGGWTVVAADTREQAIAAFNAYHPPENNILSCADVYDRLEFKETGMYDTGNLGAYAHELILITRYDLVSKF